MKAAAKAITGVTLVFIIGFLSGIGTIACFQAMRFDRPWQDARFLPRQFTPVYAEARLNASNSLRESLSSRPGSGNNSNLSCVQAWKKSGMCVRKHRPEIRWVLLETRMALRSILNEHQCKRFDELSLPMIPGRDFPGSGRCLQDIPEQKHWRGSGRKRRMRAAGNP